MLSFIILAGSLPLVAINTDDSRLLSEKTFVSANAELVLAGAEEGEVLCLDRAANNSICVTRKEWNKALTMANAQPRLRNMHRILNQQNAFSVGGSAAIGQR